MIIINSLGILVIINYRLSGIECIFSFLQLFLRIEITTVFARGVLRVIFLGNSLSTQCDQDFIF